VARPTFTAVVPTHDRPDLLIQAVDSILAQTLPANEIVVVADGPDPRVRDRLGDRPVMVIEQPNGGVATARNTGVHAAESDWVCFLDDDDLWHPDRLLRTADYIESRDDVLAVQAPYWTFASDASLHADLLASDLDGCLIALPDAKPDRDMSYLDIYGASFDLLLECNRGNIGTATVRRDVVTRAGAFPDGYRCAEDWAMFVNVARFTEWHYIDQPLSFVRIHQGNATRVRAAVNGVEILRAIDRFWAEESMPSPPHRPLTEYARDYRFVLQGSLWEGLRARRPDVLRDAVRVGLPLLPRWRDRAYALTPPPITWRIERFGRKWRDYVPFGRA
jgi:glycosyltransferase involved in cell wall biosynthesis